jgi:hypothetical protein
MRVLRALSGALLWIVGGLVGLVAVLLCVTVILLPIGIPLLGLARRMLGTAIRFMLPRSVAHPVDESSRRLRKTGEAVSDKAKSTGKTTGKVARKKGRVARTKAGRVGNDPSKRRGVLRTLSR